MNYKKFGLILILSGVYLLMNYSGIGQTYINQPSDFFELKVTEDVDRIFFPDADEGCIDIKICGLERGKSYSLFSGLLPYHKSIVPTVKSGADYVNHNRFLQIHPTEECVFLEFCYSKERPEQSPFLSYSLDINEEEEKAISKSRTMGISINGIMSAEELVRDVLIGGNCFDVHNVQSIGPPNGMGTFYTGMSSIGIEEGVVFSTGNLSNILGPNDRASTGNNMMEDGDVDLSSIVDGANTFDAVGVQFDFIPTADTVRFRYTFASEEYCEYVGDDFNDVFGFFISGPGINGPFSNGAENIALIPGTNDFVAINNVNRQDNAQFYFDNTPQGQPQGPGDIGQCGDLVNRDGVAVELIEFDGFTAVFEAVAVVIPCETYTIKMVVGDVIDGSYDSAVFLEAGSFNAGAGANLDSEVGGVDGNIIYDDCLTGYFVLNRIGGSDNTEPIVVNLMYSSMSTAIPGIDFAALPDSVVIPAHQDSILIPVEILDTYAGGSLSIIYELDFLCTCSNPFAELILAEDPNILRIDAVVNDFLSCQQDEVSLHGMILTPRLLVDFEWQDSDGNVLVVNDSIVFVNEPGEYLFIGFNNTSGCADTARVVVEENMEIPGIQIQDAETLNCEVLNTLLDATGSAIGMRYEYRWSTSDGNILTREDSIVAVADSPGTYVFEIYDTYNGCRNEQELEIAGDYESPNIVISDPDTLSCLISELEIDASLTSNNGPVSFSWTAISGNIVDGESEGVLLVNEAGEYQLQATLVRTGCTSTETVNVEGDAEIPEVTLSEEVILPCSETEITIVGNTSNHDDNISIQWTALEGSIEGSDSTFEVVVSESGLYRMSVENLDNGCTNSAEIRVIQDVPTDIDFELVQPICPGDPGVLTVFSVEGGTFPYTYSLESTISVEVNQNGVFSQLKEGQYQLLIEDRYGCIIQRDLEVEKPREIEVYLPESVIVDLAGSFRMPTEINFPESQIELIRWTPTEDLSCDDCLRPMVDIKGDREYNIYLEDHNGCPAEAKILLNAVGDPRVYIPNAFSPNYDGINDVLVVLTDNSIAEVLEWKIYDKWGNTIFSQNNFEPNNEAFGWDGLTLGGQRVNEGVYLYVATLELINGEVVTFIGDVTVMR
nr:choice-of-anchor L domain-containing protein [Saprospiraceae bacterium]